VLNALECTLDDGNGCWGEGLSVLIYTLMARSLAIQVLYGIGGVHPMMRIIDGYRLDAISQPELSCFCC
jgi:hypothetical protein